MVASGHNSLCMMACGLFENFHYENEILQNGKPSFSESTVVSNLYKKIVTNGDIVSLMDLFRSLTPAERSIFNGKEGRMKSLKLFLHDHRDAFQISREPGKGREIVRPIIGIEFCKVFDSKQGCDNQLCPKLHVCRHFVKGKCTFGTKCKKPHHFDDKHTLSILHRHYLDGLGHSQLKEFLCRNVQFALDDSVTEASLPKQLEICKYYNVAIGCSREAPCPFLHVCRFYAEDGTCKFGQKCIRRHDCKNDHARMLLQRYNIRESDVFAYLRKQRKSVKQSFLPIDAFSDFKHLSVDCWSPKYRCRTMSLGAYNAGNRECIIPRKTSEPSNLLEISSIFICIGHLKGLCKSKSCDMVHRSMPYCWQYSVDNRNWKEVGPEKNLKVEAMFVDPYQDDVIFNIEDRQRFIISFKEWIAFLTLPSKLPSREQPSVAMSIRRLSTPPSITTNDESSELNTQWVWYYMDDLKKWHTYDDMHNTQNGMSKSIGSLRIEIAYHNMGQENFMFHCDGVAYVIDFITMTQENRNTRQRTQVKRRPKIFDFNKLYMRNKDEAQLEISFFPCYWKTDELQGISGGDFDRYVLLELEPYSREYLKVFHDFGKAIGYENVLKIGAVQNIGLWMRYTMERDNLTEENQQKAEEITLYCAVSWEDAKRICKCGFENDMISANKGCYFFAKDAFLANSYNKPNANGILVTFWCRVLASSCSTMNKTDVCDEDGHQGCIPLIYHVAQGHHIYPEFIILARQERKTCQSDIVPWK